MKPDSIFNPRWWVQDPKNGFPSVRKIAGYASIAILLEVTQAALWGDKPIETGTLVSLLTAAMTGCGIYAAFSPSKGKSEASQQ